jgi:ketopantoate reductase
LNYIYVFMQVCVNAVLNPMAALLGIRNGEFESIRPAHSAMISALAEARQAALQSRVGA